MMAGVPREAVIQCHGGFDTAHCTSCHRSVDARHVKAAIFSDEVGWRDTCVSPPTLLTATPALLQSLLWTVVMIDRKVSHLWRRSQTRHRVLWGEPTPRVFASPRQGSTTMWRRCCAWNITDGEGGRSVLFGADVCTCGGEALALSSSFPPSQVAPLCFLPKQAPVTVPRVLINRCGVAMFFLLPLCAYLLCVP